MINLSQGAGEVVAADVKNTLVAYDGAILSAARLCVSVLEATQGANVPADRSQRMLHSIASGMNGAIEGREGIVQAVGHMLAIKEASNIAWADYGCPTGTRAVTPNDAQGCRECETA